MPHGGSARPSSVGAHPHPGDLRGPQHQFLPPSLQVSPLLVLLAVTSAWLVAGRVGQRELVAERPLPLDPVVTQQSFDLEQYRALRAEVLRSVEDGNQILAFGLTAIGAAVTAGYATSEALAGFAIFSVVVPVLSQLVLSMWFAAQERIARASHFLTGVEERLRAAMGVPEAQFVGWEKWLRSPNATKKTRHLWAPEYSGIALFLFVSAASLVYPQVSLETPCDVAVRVAWGVAGLVGSALIVRGLPSRVKNWRLWLCSNCYAAAEEA